MKNYDSILNDILALTDAAIEELNRDKVSRAMKFLNYIKDGIERTIEQ